ncbi:hypothetical protein CV83915_2p0226 (plasmid) [Escherichia coli]|uniref:Uncharacterized protein n=1 Tax=Escherichia coli TaxID=562 RepID=A0A2H4TL25_ECOLX|nr:hypothetical protein CV83915_2p0226 [Escherichia coli]
MAAVNFPGLPASWQYRQIHGEGSVLHSPPYLILPSNSGHAAK